MIIRLMRFSGLNTIPVHEEKKVLISNRLDFCHTEANRAMGFSYCSNKYRYLGDYNTCTQSKMAPYNVFGSRC